MCKTRNTATDFERKAVREALRILHENMRFNPASGRYECQVGSKKLSFDVEGHHAIGRVLERPTVVTV